jgi:hypothetical protein
MAKQERRPSPELVERDRKTLEALVAAGADLERPLTVDHFVHVGTEPEARNAAADLSEHGFAVVIDEPEDGGPWIVTATRQDRLSPSAVADLRDLMTRCAERHGGDYDGWGAEVNAKG